MLFSRFTSEQKADGKSNDMNSENNSGSREPRTGSLLELGIMLVALFLSGTAGIINQVIWQRALKAPLGGSETLSSMVVVLVFMLGLGIGAEMMGRRSRQIANPLKALGLIELLLAVANLLVMLVLKLGLTDHAYGVQKFMMSVGVPLRLLYGVSAFAILIVPTFLMGATLPLASDACQRSQRGRKQSLIAILFFLNTLGATLGALGSSFYLLPYHGQQSALLVAILTNTVAGLVLIWIARGYRGETPSLDNTEDERSSRGLRPEELAGFLLGFFALGYEMLLFRIMSLAHQPLPHTFALTLLFFLLFWSLGVFLSSFSQERVVVQIVLVAVQLLLIPELFWFDRTVALFSMFKVGLYYFLPCLSFGLLYGWMVSRNAKDWGRDVGRFSAMNTAGSALGILFFTLVGYEASLHHVHTFMGLLLAATAVWWWGSQTPVKRPLLGLPITAAFIVAVTVLANGIWNPSRIDRREHHVFWGRDGVIEIAPDGAVFWDGLWHSALSDGTNHLLSRNWLMAAIPALAHSGNPEHTLVIGLGTGVTTATLAKLPSVEVDTYDINHTLKQMLKEFPEGTLHVAENSKINLIWQDGRSGLALNDKTYDIITQQPLYLKQAGSSILLSREYMELVRKRLRPEGIYCVYSNSQGNDRQAMLVRRTVAAVFPYHESLQNGYALIASNDPIQFTRENFEARITRDTPFHEEVRQAEAKLEYSIYDMIDSPRLDWSPGRYLITDDHPLVEYPKVINILATREDF